MSFKPSGEEQNWAKQQEIDIKKKLQEFASRQKLFDVIGEDSSCPADGNDLEKIEIDTTGICVYKCAHCGGIWLNRSDVEKLFQSTEKSNKLIKYLANIFDLKL